MSVRQLIGATLVGLPCLGIVAAIAYMAGFVRAMAIFGVSCALTAMIASGIYLLTHE